MNINEIELYETSELSPLDDLNLWNRNYQDSLKYIEFWEHEYLQQLYYTLRIERDRMITGLNIKEDIRDDWEDKLGRSISENAIGSERIFYWLFNQFGIPNSSPIGSDLFFETHNAYINIDVKSVYGNSNLADVKERINIGKNQNSYKGLITYSDSPYPFKEFYHPNLPSVYIKKDAYGNIIGKKMNLSYFIVIVNAEKEKNIQAILLTCMPNGNLSQYYDKNFKVSNENQKASLLAPGKNYSDARYRYYDYRFFELLGEGYLRLKVLYWNERVYEDILTKFPEHEDFIKKYWNNELNDDNLNKKPKDIKEEFFDSYSINKEIFLKIRNLKDIHDGLSHLKEIYDKQEQEEKNKSILFR